MTSTEFAARYRSLKNVAMRGARSFLAQQVELGRMVMIHYLDSETPEKRSATLARLNALRSPGRDKLVEILDVDGSPVAVTLFLSSFVDFTTWLDQVSDASARPAPPAIAATPIVGVAPTAPRSAPQPVHRPGEFTQLFRKLESAPEAPPSVVSERPTASEPVLQKTPGEFTGLFGAVSTPGTSAARSEPPKPEECDAPTLIMDSPSSGRAAKKIKEPTSPAAGSPAHGAESFTAIFGAVAPSTPAHGSGSAMPPQREAANWPLPPVSPASSGADMRRPPATPSAQPIAAPAAPIFDAPSPAGAYGASAASDKPGELTQMFRQMLAGTPAVVRPGGDASPLAERADLPPARNADDRPSNPSGHPDLPGILPSPSPSVAASPGPTSLGEHLSAALPVIPRPTSPSNSPSSDDGAPNGRRVGGPPAPAWGASPPAPNVGELFGGSVAGQSEYTRVLHGIASPPPPPIVIQAPGAEAAVAAGGKKPAKSLLPLIIALAAIGALTIAIVAYLLFAK